jgi:BA14K-like protein
MNKLKTITAISALLVAAPAVAQEMGGGSYGPAPGYARSYGYYQGYRDDGFWPGRVAGDVVGGAIGTAGAIATAPFRAPGADSYAAMGPDENYCAQRYRSFDPASGTFMGYDGRRHPCP